MRRLFTLLIALFLVGIYANAQETPLLTGETTPEAITYYDFVEWSIEDATKIPTWYVDFGTGGPFTQFVDNPDMEGINTSAKSLYMATTTAVDWWGNFLNFRLETPVTITEANRYLHIMHYRENLTEGWSFSLNVNEPLSDAEKGTLRFDGNNAVAGKWEDIVIDLGYLIDQSIQLEKFMVIVDKDWTDPRDNPPTKYYFDEIVLSDDPLQRGVTILEGTELLGFERQTQMDSLTISTQNETNTWEVVANPFTESWLNADGHIGKFHKSADASWWQGFHVTFPGIHVLEYGEKQYLHVLVQTDTTCYIQLHIVDNLGKEFTEMFLYPFADINGEWYDLVWDVSSYTAAVAKFTVRCDVRLDENDNYINGTPARDFYIDEIQLNGIEDPREGEDPSIGVAPSFVNELKAYTVGTEVFFEASDIHEVAVYDMLGKKVVSQQFDGISGLNSVSVKTPGIYILRVANGNLISTAKVLVK